MKSLLSFFRMHWDHEPDWHPSPCLLPARRGEGGRRPGEVLVHGKGESPNFGRESGPRTAALTAEWDKLPACQLRTGKMPVPLSEVCAVVSGLEYHDSYSRFNSSSEKSGDLQ